MWTCFLSLRLDFFRKGNATSLYTYLGLVRWVSPAGDEFICPGLWTLLYIKTVDDTFAADRRKGV